MTQVSSLYWLHALSPLHVGAGEGVGAIDLPIMREKVTEWPMIPGSSIKGVQRDFYSTSKKKDKVWLDKAFGTGGDQDANAGALVMTDARILAFPVASRYGTFAYVTCPLVLKRLWRDAAAGGVELTKIDPIKLQEFEKKSESEVQSWVTKSSVLSSKQKEGTHVYLDEFSGLSRGEIEFDSWAEDISKLLFNDKEDQDIWKERVVLVSDDTFQYFVTMCCEVTPRIRISLDSKTVEKGALWNEEYVPTEAIFYGLIWCDQIKGDAKIKNRKDLLAELEQTSILQIGGNASVGKGRVRCRIVTGGTA